MIAKLLTTTVTVKGVLVGAAVLGSLYVVSVVVQDHILLHIVVRFLQQSAQ